MNPNGARYRSSPFGQTPPQSGGGTVGLQGGVVPPAYQSGNSAGGFQGGNTAGGFQSGNSAGGFQGGNSAGGFQGGNSAAGFQGGNSAGGFQSGNSAAGFQGGNSAGGFTGGNFSGGFSNGNGSSPPQAPAFPGQQHGNQEAFSNLKNDLNQGFDDAMLAAGVNPFLSNAGKEILASGVASNFAGLQKYVPGWLQHIHEYFRVTHSLVLSKLRFLLCPFRYLKMDLPEDMKRADLYVPLMAYITYVLLYGICRGIHQDFHPELLGSTATFAFILLILEVIGGQVGFFLAGTSNISALDLCSFSGYKYVPLVTLLCLMLCGLCDGYLYFVFVAYLAGCAGVSMYCLASSKPALKAMQGNMGEITNDSLLHKQVIIALAAAQVALCWILTPSLSYAVVKAQLSAMPIDRDSM